MKNGLGWVVGRSPRMRSALYLAEAVAGNPSTVLLTGESGTGKEVLARFIHRHSGRSELPFLAVNCGSIPATLLESQLFGHTKGAFTGAVANIRGFFRAAEGGTIFLDEIGELDLTLQVKLLRALQERTVTPVGATQSIRFDARILAATNIDLHEAMRAGTFREDLYYRLNVVNIHLPPIRDRVEDIPEIVEYLSERIAKRFGVEYRSITPETLDVLQQHRWPGNVRELENAIERSYAVGHGPTITMRDMPEDVFGPRSIPASGKPESVLTYDDMERHMLSNALKSSGGNKSRAARLLGINRQRLYRRLAKFGLL